jgi:uncharacterized protein
VRDLGGDPARARIDVDPGATGQVSACAQALAAVRDAGFDVVEVDPRGFRSGSLNDALAGS